MKRSLVALLPLASLGLLGNAHAATDTTTFNVTITITESCDIHTVAATDVDFGSVVRSSAAVSESASGNLVVNCSDGTPYTIGLNNGGNYSGSRRMTDGTNFVSYGLFRDNAHSNPWGNTTDLLSGTGDGTDQNIPVYGLVTSVNVPAGTYNDIVTATVTY
ncbi:MAG: spore coat U domain-containing protein [Pedobacter sp.]|nr:spore coat U domain-containing protein [Pedobacter sp.]